MHRPGDIRQWKEYGWTYGFLVLGHGLETLGQGWIVSAFTLFSQIPGEEAFCLPAAPPWSTEKGTREHRLAGWLKAPRTEDSSFPSGFYPSSTWLFCALRRVTVGSKTQPVEKERDFLRGSPVLKSEGLQLQSLKGNVNTLDSHAVASSWEQVISQHLLLTPKACG